MKTKFILGVFVLILISGCSFGGMVSPVPTQAQPVPTMPTGDGPLPQFPWISPGKVQIGNFYPGAQAEWYIKVHNGYTVGEITYTVKTEVGDTTADLPLPKGLKDGSLSEVVKVVSSLGEDTPRLEGYNMGTKELSVSGLVPTQTRTMSVVYNHRQPSTYSVYYKLPSFTSEGFSNPPEGAKDWVIVADPSPVLAPFETREILITLAMPEKTLYSETFVATSSGSTAKVSLSNYLYNASTSYIVALSSTMVGERPEVVSYDLATKELVVGNLASNRQGEALSVSYYGVTNAPNRWEFWIGVTDVSQGGMIQTELCSRWMVSMR